jgi:hypothetical protein
VLCLVPLLAGALHAQLNRGTLAGTVSDPSGAMIPNAKTTIRNIATNATYGTETSSGGQYTMPNLPSANTI